MNASRYHPGVAYAKRMYLDAFADWRSTVPGRVVFPSSSCCLTDYRRSSDLVPFFALRLFGIGDFVWRSYGLFCFAANLSCRRLRSDRCPDSYCYDPHNVFLLELSCHCVRCVECVLCARYLVPSIVGCVRCLRILVVGFVFYDFHFAIVSFPQYSHVFVLSVCVLFLAFPSSYFRVLVVVFAIHLSLSFAFCFRFVLLRFRFALHLSFLFL